MTTITPPIGGQLTITDVTGADGYFTVKNSDGSSQKMTFAELVMSMGMLQLSLQDQYFEAQYAKTSQMAEEMREVNDMVAMLTKFKGYFDANGKATSNTSSTDGNLANMPQEDREQWLAFREKFVDTGKIQDKANGYGIGTDCVMSLQDVEEALASAEAYQKNLSSLNEQQMMTTNQAASRRSNVLQQLQTLLAAEKEGRSAATR